MNGNPNLYIPDDLLNQFGNFEHHVIAQPDAKVTNFSEPFGVTHDLSRLKQAYWIKSQSVGQAFKINDRKIVEYASLNS